MPIRTALGRLIANVAARVGGISTTEGNSRAGLVELPTWKSDYPLPYTGDFRKNLEATNQLITVRRAIQIISQCVARVSLKLLKKQGEENVEVKHPIAELLEWVNPFLAGDDLWGITTTYFKLTGNAYWAFEKNFTEIWPLRPDRVRILPNQKDFIGGYEYKNETTQKKVIYPPEEILHFKGISTLSMFYGDSNIEAGSRELAQEMAAILYNYRYFENDATPPGILTSPLELNEDDVKRIRVIWNASHKGLKNVAKTAILDKNLTYTKTGDSMKDMAYENLRRFNREQIAMLFGVPPAIMGDLTHADYANIRHQDKLLWSYTIIPLLRQFETVLNQIMLLRFKGTEGMFFQFDLTNIEALQDTTAEKTTNAVQLWNSQLAKRNEARKIAGLAPVNAIDDIWKPSPVASLFGQPPDGMNAQGDQSMMTNGNAGKNLIDEDRIVNRVRQLVAVPVAPEGAKSEYQPVVVNNYFNQTKEESLPDARELSWKRFDERLVRQEGLFAKTMQNFFDKQASRILDKFDELYPEEKAIKDVKPNTEDFIFDVILENGKLKGSIGNRFRIIIRAAALTASQDLEAAIDFELNNPRVGDFLQTKDILISGINDSTKEQIRQRVINAVNEGWSPQQLRDEITNLFDDISQGRAMTIARTETAGAYNFGTKEAWRQSGVVSGNEWITARDERVRPTHQALDKEVRGLDEPFSNGLMYPGQPGGAAEEVINCRCSLLSVR